MRTSIFYCLVATLFVGCGSGTLVKQGEEERQPFMDHWENIYLYFSPPADYKVVGMVTGKGDWLFNSDEGKMKDALQGMKKEALDAGATGVLIQSAGITSAGSVGVASWQGSGSGGFLVGSSVPVTNGSMSGLAIFVPADAANFSHARVAHESKCASLAENRANTKAALKATKKTGTAAEIAAVKQELDAAENAQDAEHCGDDDWFARQMESQQAIMDKMRAEDAASRVDDQKTTTSDHDALCLEAAQKNDLAAWQKLGCK